jgi:hypothetical protein
MSEKIQENVLEKVQEQTQEKVQEQKKLKRTDLKPLKFSFVGSSDELIKKFYSKVKAIEGVVKYKMVDWEGFPTDSSQAKSLAKDWATKFYSLQGQNKKFEGFIVNIYFHLEKKTIRFEVKKYIKSNEVEIKIKHIVLTSSDNSDGYKNQIFSNLSNQVGTYTFDSSCWDILELNECKRLGKSWALELESREDFAGLKVIVFLNPSKKNIKVSIK